MTGSPGPRAAILAAVALLAIAGAVAIHKHSSKASDLPAAAGSWYSALAAPYTPSGKRTKCKPGADPADTSSRPALFNAPITSG